jgi:Spy/CpxP family protein refolding chaperone
MKKKFIAITTAAFVLAGSMAACAATEQKPLGRDGQRMPKALRYMGPGPVIPKNARNDAQKAQAEKLRGLYEELRTELQKTTPDKDKARAINEQILDVKDAMENDRFNEMLANPRKDRGPEGGMQMSEEQIAKMKELRDTRDALMEEMHKDSPDKAKATELHNKEMQLRRSIEKDRFEAMLANPGKFKKGPEAGERPQLSPATKAKFDKLKAIHEQMNAEFQKGTPDKNKIRSLHKQAQAIKNSLDDERFEQRLNDPQKGMGFHGYGLNGRDNGKHKGRGPKIGKNGMYHEPGFRGGHGPDDGEGPAPAPDQQ